MKKPLFLAVILLLIAGSALVGMELYTQKPSFCGSCHIMNRSYDSWEKSKHRNIPCVDCHYAPGESHTIKAKFKGLSQLFSYLSTNEVEVRKKASIDDASCEKAGCHPPKEYLDKSIPYGEKSSFVHQTHAEKRIEGQKLHCNTCHLHTAGDKHFSVPKEACFLCHFKNVDFNKDRGKCLLCHQLPEKPIQQHGEKPITHKQLQEANVQCESCHIQVIGGTGAIKEDACRGCHDRAETLKKSGEKKLMHQNHVANQHANCFNCHESIQHKETDFLTPVVEECAACHPDHHSYQKILLRGFMEKGDKITPNPMFASRTNCLGCHLEESTDRSGQKLIKGTSKACVSCHSKEHRKMLKDWMKELNRELKDALALEKEARRAIKKAKGNVPDDKVQKAKQMFELGQTGLRIVEYGNGIHNKKYAMMLLDSAFINFEDLIDMLNKK